MSPTTLERAAAGRGRRRRRTTRADAALRLALKLRAKLTRRPSTVPSTLDESLRRLTEAQHQLERFWRMTRLARHRRWYAAADHVAERLPAALQRVQAAAEAARWAQTGAAAATVPEPTVPDLLREIDALGQVFDHVHLDLRHGVLAAETEPIVLRDVDLGPFRIELRLRELSDGRCDAQAFACVGLEPNPAAGRSDATHPHVSYDRPYLGEATAPVTSALRDGRLADAFLAVAAVLRTYNGRSPYVPLDGWEGRSCDDCGRTRPEDELGGCRECEQVMCDSCCSSCDACDETYCRSCLDGSDDDRELCPDCRRTCRECDAMLSSDRLDADGRCTSCAEAAEQDDDEGDNDDGGEGPSPGSPPAELPVACLFASLHPQPEQDHVSNNVRLPTASAVA